VLEVLELVTSKHYLSLLKENSKKEEPYNAGINSRNYQKT
jgi:hypothetical protein